MRFGLFSNGQRLRSPEQSFELDLREIVTADRLGYEEVWISEHTGQPWMPFGMAAPELLMCKAAALTGTIRLGAAVRRIALYPPQMVAIEGAITDRLTGGRYNFGFGAGPPVTNYAQWGIESDRVGPMTIEAIDLIERCWTSSEPFDFDGQHYRGRGIDLYPKPLQPRIPVAVASGNERMLKLAAERSWRVLTTWSAPASAIAKIGQTFDEACRGCRDGQLRRQDLTVARLIYVAPTEGLAWDHVAENLREVLAFSRMHLEPAASQLRRGPKALETSLEDTVQAGNIILGDPDQVAASIRRLYEDVGGFGTLLVVTGRDFATPDQIDAMLRRFAEEVQPQLKCWRPRHEPAASLA